jgi:hypothetical protein
MPNHCSQDLRVYGKKETIEKMFNEMKEGDKHLSANKIMPYPEHFRIADELAKIEREKGNFDVKDGYNSGGYEWCNENWGTKWGMYDFSHVIYNKTSTVLSFYSAWSPADKLILKLSELYPTLKFQLNYYEQGMGYSGKVVYKNGQELERTENNNYRGNRGG